MKDREFNIFFYTSRHFAIEAADEEIGSGILDIDSEKWLVTFQDGESLTLEELKTVGQAIDQEIEKRKAKHETSQ
jgi:cell division GTPase FtsZ